MKKVKYLGLLLCMFCFILIYINSSSSSFSSNNHHHIEIKLNSINFSAILQNDIDNELLITPEFDVNRDTLSFLHIQKTSGTYWIEEIKKNLMVMEPRRKYWLKVCKYITRAKVFTCSPGLQNRKYSQFLFWIKNNHFNCDIHANYAELIQCISRDNTCISMRKLHVMTILRNPINRYVSEYYHIKRGATWEKAVRKCLYEPIHTFRCFNRNSNWSHATWYDFLNCEYNLANNRQVRMLADYNELGCDVLKCWTKSEQCSNELKKQNEEKIYESAKKTLISLSFFGLTEYQELSHYLFEKTFENKLKFDESFQEEQLESNIFCDNECMNSIDLIMKNNHLDIRLYEFATKLFFARIKYFHDKQ